MEWIIGALVVLGFIAIAVRFVPRDDTGRVSLPAIVDDSLGMWVLRRLPGLPQWDRRHAANAASVAELRSAANASGSTAVGAGGSIGPTPIGPTRFVASASRLQQIGARPVGSIRRPVSTTPPFTVRFMRGSTDRGRQPHKAVAPLVLQRRLSAIAAVLVVGVVALGVVLAPRASRGGVLGVTGGPARDGGPPPPIASVTCTHSSLTVTCDGSGSDREVSYKFDFEGGPSGTTGPDPTASYAYSVGGTYTITLTVADEFGRTSADSATVTLR